MKQWTNEYIQQWGEISKKLGLKLSNVYKYSANVSIEQKGTNAGIYLDEITLERCLAID